MADSTNSPPSAPQASPPPPASPAPRKKSSWVRWTLKLGAALVLLLIIAVVILFLNLNTLVRMGVVRGGRYATDQETILSAADLSLSGGTLQLTGLDISNLHGYKDPNILSMKNCSTRVQSSTLFSHTVVVDEMNFDGLEVNLEQNGAKNNLSELVEIIRKKTAATGNAQNESPGKELKIGIVRLTNTKVHLRAAPLGDMTLDLPPLEMIDPTNPDGRRMKVADLIATILLQLSRQIMENPQIPGSIKDGMKNIDALIKEIPQLNKDLKDPSKLLDLGKSLGNSTRGAQDIGKGLQDLLKQKKEPDPVP